MSHMQYQKLIPAVSGYLCPLLEAIEILFYKYPFGNIDYNLMLQLNFLKQFLEVFAPVTRSIGRLNLTNLTTEPSAICQSTLSSIPLHK